MRIREIRTAKGITQTELAAIMRVGQSTISHWESGAYSPTLQHLRRLAEVLNCTADELLGDA